MANYHDRLTSESEAKDSENKTGWLGPLHIEKPDFYRLPVGLGGALQVRLCTHGALQRGDSCWEDHECGAT